MRRGDANGQVTLVAMPASGEVFIARDSAGVLWLVSPPGAGGPERVDDEIVERALADHGFELVDERFEGWEQLDAERQRRAAQGSAPVEVDVMRFDAEDVEGVLRALDRARLRGEIPRARRVAHRLLEAPVLRTDDELYRRVVGFLQTLDAATVSMPSAVTEPLRKAARERLRLVA